MDDIELDDLHQRLTTLGATTCRLRWMGGDIEPVDCLERGPLKVYLFEDLDPDWVSSDNKKGARELLEMWFCSDSFNQGDLPADISIGHLRGATLLNVEVQDHDDRYDIQLAWVQEDDRGALLVAYGEGALQELFGGGVSWAYQGEWTLGHG